MRRSVLWFFVLVSFPVFSQTDANYNYYRNNLAQPPADDWSSGNRDFTADAKVMLYVPAESWVLVLQGSEDGATAEDARRKLQLRIDALTKKLSAEGIPATDITVTTESTVRNTNWKTDAKGASSTFITYTLTKNITIIYRDAEKYNVIVSDASEQGLDRVVSSYCTVADEQEVYAELYRQAMDVALTKQQQNADTYHAEVLPSWTITMEQYDVFTPAPGVYVAPGSQRGSITGYDRMINAEYGSGAVRYTLHLQITYTLSKQSRTNSPATKTK